MAEKDDMAAVQASGEQLLYANILNKGMIVGIIVLLLTYAVYVSGILPTFIPVEDVPKTWHKSVAEYTHDYNAPTGWDWAKHVKKGDYLNFVGIAILAAVSILCYAAIVPGLMRKKETIMVVIVILEILVLCFAASGILKSGGH
jgi:hypothetical protein